MCSQIYKFVPTEHQAGTNKWGVLKNFHLNEVINDFSLIEMNFSNLNGYKCIDAH